MTTTHGGHWTAAMAAAAAVLIGAAAGHAEQPVAVPAAAGVRSLSEFGPLKTPAEVKAAYARAKAEMTDGGVLLVPPGTAALHSEENTAQISPRTPAPPAETKQWKKAGPGITVVEINADGTVVQGPQVQGVTIERTLRMPLTESLPHWTSDHALTIRNKLVHGSQSYLDWTSEPIVPGNDARVYVNTIRGLRVGAFVNILGKGVTRACIKSLGFDPEKKKHYFTADVAAAHPARAVVQNKSNEGVIYMTQEGNADNQTYDIMLNRYQYALGDCYMYFARYRYMSNIHSSGGDENGKISPTASPAWSMPWTGRGGR
ncbi:MAG: hypothetical protein EBZ59_03215 [Planctomycetia bacterium]|nr:hypothetical protein [Planctomycetia bacterium]